MTSLRSGPRVHLISLMCERYEISEDLANRLQLRRDWNPEQSVCVIHFTKI